MSVKPLNTDYWEAIHLSNVLGFSREFEITVDPFTVFFGSHIDHSLGCAKQCRLFAIRLFNCPGHLE